MKTKYFLIIYLSILFISILISFGLSDVPANPGTPNLGGPTFPSSDTSGSEFPGNGTNQTSNDDDDGDERSGYRRLGSHNTVCDNDDDCRLGLCCTVGGLQPGECHYINDLHGGRCMSSNVIVPPAGNQIQPSNPPPREYEPEPPINSPTDYPRRQTQKSLSDKFYIILISVGVVIILILLGLYLYSRKKKH